MIEFFFRSCRDLPNIVVAESEVHVYLLHMLVLYVREKRREKRNENIRFHRLFSINTDNEI